MPIIITCPCGARIRRPDDGGAFRCPRCKAELLTTADARVLASAPVAPGTTATTCPICQSALQSEEPTVICPECEQVHHRDCWMEIGGCSTYGCAQAPPVSKEPARAGPPLTAWGDTKTCPACGETIKSIAMRCRYCKTDFDTVDPLKASDLRRSATKADDLHSLKVTVVVLFAVSLIGCFAPLALLVSLGLLLPKRKLLARAGPVFQVLAYACIGLSALYSVLMIVFIPIAMAE